MAGDFAIVTLVLSVTSVGAGALSSVIGVRWAITVFAAVAACWRDRYLVLTRNLRSRRYRLTPAGPDEAATMTGAR